MSHKISCIYFLFGKFFYSIIPSSWYFSILSSGIVTTDREFRKLRKTWFVIRCINNSVIFYVLAVIRTSCLSSRGLWTPTTVIKSKIRLRNITFSFEFLLWRIHVLTITFFIRDIILVLCLNILFIILLLILVLPMIIILLAFLFIHIFINIFFIILLLLLSFLIRTVLILLETLLKILLLNSILISQSVSFYLWFYLTFHFFLNMVNS